MVYLKSLLLQHIDCPKLPFQLKAAEGFKNEAMASFLLNGGERPSAQGGEAAATSGEGFVNVIEGTGRVLLAPVPNIYVNLVNEMRSVIPTSSS